MFDEVCSFESLEPTLTKKAGAKATKKAQPKKTVKVELKRTVKQKALLSEVNFVASCST